MCKPNFIHQLTASLALVFAFGAHTLAEEPDSNKYGFAHIEAQGTNLFAIPIPGETYSPLSGKIGHGMTDMTITGNGPLPIVLQRKYEEIPKAYPHAFGSMSLVIPHLMIDVQTDAAHDTSTAELNLLCGTWKQPGSDGASWNDIKFYYEGGMVSLIDKDVLQDAELGNYPPEALYISKNNWYLRCSGSNNDGAAFEVYSPSGLKYVMTTGERTAHLREHEDTDRYYSMYTTYVTKVHRAGSTLTYVYEDDVASDNHELAIFTPRFFGKHKAASGTGQTDRNTIRGKKRLIEIVASNNQGNDNRKVDIEYYPANAGFANGACGGKIKRISSAYASNSSVEYRYERNTNSITEHSVDQCLLSEVRYADNSTFKFEYGVQNQTGYQFVFLADVFGGPTGAQKNQVTFPLRRVTTPTGARVTYEYVLLGTCEYQDVYEDHNALHYTDFNSCPGDSPARNLAVTDRLVEDSHSPASFPSNRHWFQYDKLNGVNRVTRTINNDARHHVLTYGRIDRFEPPTTATEDSGRRLHSGRLLRHEVKSNAAGNPVLSDTSYTYLENKNFLDYAIMDTFYPDNENDPYFRLESGRYKYMYDALRINRNRKTINMNGSTFETVRRSFNEHNLPTRIDELFNAKSRTTAINYEDSPANTWFIGNFAYKEIGETQNNEPSGDLLKTYRTFTGEGLLKTDIALGFTSTYDYHPWGDVKSVTDGNGNTTTFPQYQNGVAKQTKNALNAVNWEYADDNGLTYKIVDSQGNTENFRYDSMGQLNRQWEGTVQSDNETKINNPTWHSASDGNFRRKRVLVPGYSKELTWFDGLGRPTRVKRENLKNGSEEIWQTFEYDQLGRTTFVSDPQPQNRGAIANWPGTWHTHDAFDRTLSTKHTARPEKVEYGYGLSCNSGAFAIVGFPVAHGYCMKDRAGFKTLYKFEAYGNPSNSQLTHTMQQISSSETVVTAIQRNFSGFITSVSQDGLTRTYTPFKHSGANGSLTTLVEEETHPEFIGEQTVNSYDGVGNPTSMTTYEGDTLTYGYTALNQLNSVSSNDGSYSANFTYFNNGQPKTASSNGTVWTYLYESDRPLLRSEKLDVDSKSFLVSYDYGNHGILSQMTYPAGLKLKPTFNGFGQTVSMEFNSGLGFKPLVSNASYHPNGQLHTVQYSNGQTFTATQNSRWLPENWGSKKVGTMSDTLALKYHYDGRNNVTRIDDYFAPVDINLHDLTYDGLNRLTAASGQWGTVDYAYDKLSNIESTTFTGSNLYNLNYQYDSQNRLSSVSSSNEFSAPSKSFFYDDNGNVLSNGLKTFTYDAVNQMLTANSVPGTGSKSLANVYDANRHRAKATVTNNGVSKSTYSVYVGGSLIFEEDLETGEQRNHLFFDGKSVATLGSHNDVDTDSDGIPDYYERLHGLNSNDATDGDKDADGDGITNYGEYQLGGMAMSTDSDNDGLPDNWERDHYLDIDVTDSLNTDSDGDGISNFQEYQNGSNPSDHLFSDEPIDYLVPAIQQL